MLNLLLGPLSELPFERLLRNGNLEGTLDSDLRSEIILSIENIGVNYRKFLGIEKYRYSNKMLGQLIEARCIIYIYCLIILENFRNSFNIKEFYRILADMRRTDDQIEYYAVAISCILDRDWEYRRSLLSEIHKKQRKIPDKFRISSTSIALTDSYLSFCSGPLHAIENCLKEIPDKIYLYNFSKFRTSFSNLFELAISAEKDRDRDSAIAHYSRIFESWMRLRQDHSYDNWLDAEYIIERLVINLDAMGKTDESLIYLSGFFALPGPRQKNPSARLNKLRMRYEKLKIQNP